MLALLFYTLDKNPGWVPDYQSEGVRLVVNQSVVPVDLESSPEDRSCLSMSIIWGYIPYTNTLYNKYCLLILPLFVAICEIWLPGLTYGVYLVLFLKPGATILFRVSWWNCTLNDPSTKRRNATAGKRRLHVKKSLKTTVSLTSGTT